jgi:hypothetical protein
MLLQKAYEPQTVVSFKLLSGEEIVSRVSEETDTHYSLTKPLALIATPQGGLGLAPVMFSVDPKNSLMLNKAAVMLHAKTQEELASQYMAQTSGLTLAKAI